MNLDFLKGLKEQDFSVVELLPKHFDETTFKLIATNYRSIFMDIFSKGQEERQVASFFVPNENISKFTEYYNSQINEIVNSLIAKHDRFIKHFLFIWAFDCKDINQEDKGEIFGYYKSNQSSEVLFNAIKAKMPESLADEFDFYIVATNKMASSGINRMFPEIKAVNPDEIKKEAGFESLLNKPTVLTTLQDFYMNSGPQKIMLMCIALFEMGHLNSNPFNNDTKLWKLLQKSFGYTGARESILYNKNQYLDSKRPSHRTDEVNKTKQLIEKLISDYSNR